MPRVIHFEINADDPKRAAKFYEKVFGWKIEKWGPVDYWLATTGNEKEPGIDGAIMERFKKGTTFIFVEVPSVDDFLKKVINAGGKEVTKKAPIPGVGYSAYCKDTEGNIFGLFQRDPKAK
ncbi:MAG: VOC family protein [Candidatus Bathyarchaeia archaeon]